VASGDASGSATGRGRADHRSYYFLTNLDVQNSAAAVRGHARASITEGCPPVPATTAAGPTIWPAGCWLAGEPSAYSTKGSGTSCFRTVRQSALNRFQRDVVQQPGVHWVIFSDDPINDLGNARRRDRRQLINGSGADRGGASGRHRVPLLDADPAAPRSSWTQQAETEREAIDAFIRGAGSGCDAIVDQDTATHDPNNPTTYLPAYNSGDNLHPNEVGLRPSRTAVGLGEFGSPSGTPVISLRAHANGDYVTAESAGASALIANRTRSALGASTKSTRQRKHRPAGARQRRLCDGRVRGRIGTDRQPHCHRDLGDVPAAAQHRRQH